MNKTMMSIVMAGCIVSAATVGSFVGSQNAGKQNTDYCRVIVMTPRNVKVFYRKPVDEDKAWQPFDKSEYNIQYLERCLYNFRFEQGCYKPHITGLIDCTNRETIIEPPKLEEIAKEF